MANIAYQAGKVWKKPSKGSNSIVDQEIGESLYNYNTNNINADELLEQIARQLHDHRLGVNLSGDLIDEMVRILGLPYPPNVLGHRTLERLTRAILLPEEIASLRSGVNSGEAMSCRTCGRRMHNEEMCTVRNVDGMIGIDCTNCYTPIMISCSDPNCEHGVPLESKIIKYLNKEVKCATHSATPNTTEKSAEEGDDGEMPPFFRAQLDNPIQFNYAAPAIGNPPILSGGGGRRVRGVPVATNRDAQRGLRNIQPQDTLREDERGPRETVASVLRSSYDDFVKGEKYRVKQEQFTNGTQWIDFSTIPPTEGGTVEVRGDAGDQGGGGEPGGTIRGDGK
jgi:hypothetical protein